jgi:hypothetical protein
VPPFGPVLVVSVPVTWPPDQDQPMHLRGLRRAPQTAGTSQKHGDSLATWTISASTGGGADGLQCLVQDLSRWQTFDARHNTPRIGQILMARGRDATDVALSTIFGPSALIGFNVVTEAMD